MSVTVVTVSSVAITTDLADQSNLGVDSSDKQFKQSQGQSRTLTASSTPAATAGSVFRQAMTAGAATIDLRAIPTVNSGTIDGNGKKVRVLRLSAPGTNANPITITPGASNGLNVFGATGEITLNPGDTVQLEPATAGATAIDATHKTLDLAGTGTQVLDVAVVVG